MDVFGTTKRPVTNEEPCVFVSTLPFDTNVAKKVFQKVLPRYKHFAVLVTTDTLTKGYFKNIGRLQFIFVKRPIRFLKKDEQGKIVLNEIDHPQKFVWVTKGLELPHDNLWAWGPEKVQNDAGTACWDIEGDRLRATQRESNTNVVCVAAEKTTEVNPDRVTLLLCETNTRSAIQGFSILRKATEALVEGKKTFAPQVIRRLVATAIEHTDKNGTNGQTCRRCRRKQNKNGINECQQDCLEICKMLLTTTRVDCSLRKLAIAYVTPFLNEETHERYTLDSYYPPFVTNCCTPIKKKINCGVVSVD